MYLAAAFCVPDRRRPDEVVPQHKRRAAVLWVLLIFSIFTCESIRQGTCYGRPQHLVGEPESLVISGRRARRDNGHFHILGHSCLRLEYHKVVQQSRRLKVTYICRY